MAQLGEMLKNAREEKGVTLAEAEAAIHIRHHLLEALEQNNFGLFPSPVMARGLIRNYAKYLDLDPLEALTRYDGHGLVAVKGQRVTPQGVEFMNLAMAPRPFFTWDLLIGIILFLAVAGAVIYVVYGQTGLVSMLPATTPTPSVQEFDTSAALPIPTVTPLPTQTPTPIPPTETPTPVVFSGVTVELLLLQPSWVQILVDDVKAFEGILQAGEARAWTGERRVAIRAGNAGGVEVVVNGLNRGVMGTEGQVADQVWEKVDSSAALTPAPPTETPVPVDSSSEASFDTAPTTADETGELEPTAESDQ